MFIIIYKLKYKSHFITIEAFNSKTYLVNNLSDSQDAANLLAKLMLIIDKLINNIILDFDTGLLKTQIDIDYINYIRTIKKKLPYVKISENPTDSQYTSYSINKGEELVFCIRDKKYFKLHDINELLYVAIHEIAHIGCPEIGHTDLFQNINLYLLEKAVCYNLYRYINYSDINKDYCGMILTSTILSDTIKCHI
jgi:predicted metal-dependent hydrolase